MADTEVILAGIAFKDFAVPDKINAGGKHIVQKHTLIGGQRIVDAMGPEADDIRWQGRFRGSAALSNAEALDQIRMSGAAVPLTWMGLYYTVIVTGFEFSTEKFYEVPYTITCMVVTDPMQGLGTLISSLDSLVSGDYVAAAAIALPTALAATVAGLGTTIDNAGTLVGADSATVLSVASAASAASDAFDTAVIAADPALDTTSPIGADPADMVTWLASATTAMNDQAAAVVAGSYVTRIGINLALNEG